MGEMYCQRVRKMLGSVRGALPSLILWIVEKRARFQRKLSGKVVVGREVQGLKHATFRGKNAVGSGAFFAGRISVGYATTIGASNYLVGPVTIGNYCQLGPAVAIYGTDHPTGQTTMYFNQNLFNGRLKQHAVIAETSVGHDVWIGHGAVLLKGVHIGNGAVIGAGAVVTRDVRDYAIAVGNPAQVLRMRFDEELIELLAQTKWWLKSTEELQPFEELFHLDLAKNREKGIALLRRMARSSDSAQERTIGSESCQKPAVLA
jgi:acetyltransferase-like isoleucine patch superfamily enzyme